jgi:TPR repeat protein
MTINRNEIRVLYAAGAFFVASVIYRVPRLGLLAIPEAIGYAAGTSPFWLPIILVLLYWFGRKDKTGSAPVTPKASSPKPSPEINPPKLRGSQEEGNAEYWYRRALSLTDESQYLECFQCLERAVTADPNHVQSLYAIAYHYLHGQGVQEDLPTASKWFRKAAELDFSPAQDKLGTMYEHGIGVANNFREAAKWYLRAAVKGHADAQYHLGVLYGNGQGFPIDYVESVKWCRKAAEQGNSDAQSTLAKIYMNGVEGVPKNMDEAAHWFRKAADNGDAESQFYTGLLFEHGDGVLQDLEEAARYYSLSGDQGYTEGQRGLQRINMTLGRYTVSDEPLPGEEDWEYEIRRMVESTRFEPPRKRE